jgi:hypothetical protein
MAQMVRRSTVALFTFSGVGGHARFLRCYGTRRTIEFLSFIGELPRLTAALG